MIEIADADLPVFPFKVNWKNGISERLEWKTDILGDLVGNEQRRGLRLHPRRDFEVTLTLWDGERSFLDLWMHRMVGTEFLFPLWHDSVRASQPALQGQKTIWVDTGGLEFGIGSYGLLRGLTAMSFERFEIAAIYPDRIETVDNLAKSWASGTRVEPLVRGRMSDQTRMAMKSSRAAETQAEFQTTRAQLYDEGVDSADQYLGLPVLTKQPNRTDGIDVQAVWSFFESDSGTGRRYRKSEVGRAMASQKHSWFLRGRTAKAEFRSLLYRLKGALGTIWLPTFADDMTLAQDAPVNAASIYINEIGFDYTGGPTSGREHILIETTTGRLYRRVTGTAVAPAGQERLTLDAPIPAGLARASVRRISWIDTARLENDRIEFNHVNAADGVSTVSSIFKTFRNERTPPEILSVPIPESGMVPGSCGDGGGGPVLLLPRHSPGWKYKLEPFDAVVDYSAPGFNDSAWLVGTAPFYKGVNHPFSAIRNWGGFAGGTDIVTNQDVWMRKEIYCTPGKTLEITTIGDNQVTVWIDGNQVLQNTFGDRVVTTIVATEPTLTVVLRVDETHVTSSGNYTFGDLEIWQLS